MVGKKLMILFFFLGTFFLGIAAASAYTVYLPHITGDSYYWTDYLQVDNDSLSDASFQMTLYGSGGTVAHEGSYNVSALSERVLYVKDYAASAKTGIITYNNERLKFRLSYQNNAGGVAEFRLDDTLSSDIGLYFSSSEVLPDITGKGAAIANMGNTAADVTLYAIGGGSIIDSYSATIDPNSQIIGVVGSSWFSSVSASDVKKIIAVEDSGSNCLTGIVICTNSDLSKLLFTPSATVTDFNTGTTDLERASIVLFNDLNCGGSDFECYLSIDGKSLTSSTGEYSNCYEDITCDTDIVFDLSSESTMCGQFGISGGSVTLTCGDAFLFGIELDNTDQPDLVIYQYEGGDCSTFGLSPSSPFKNKSEFKVHSVIPLQQTRGSGAAFEELQ